MIPLSALPEEFATIAVASALCTIAVALLTFAVLGGIRANRDLLWAGLFSACYGVRLALDTEWADTFVPHREWFDSALEYLVPMTGAMLFLHKFGHRWRTVGKLTVAAFVLCGVVLFPYELITRQPGAGNPIVNSVVMVLLIVLLLNLLLPDPATAASELRLVRGAAAVFGLFVFNEHWRLVPAEGVLSEPVGFLIFMATIAYVVIRRSITDRVRLAGVEGELATARRIQMSILPAAPPAHPSISIETRYLPAADVAGDFYEFLEIEDGRIGVFIADVSGHGVPAALVASMLKIAVASQAAHAAAPAKLLHELNQVFIGRLGRQFITAAYACVGNGAITLASAGHPPPIVRHEEDIYLDSTELYVDGVVLGRFRDAVYHEATVPFGPGDRVLFYTDGVTEARRGDEMFGTERLVFELEAILEELRSWTVEDDVTLIALHHRGGSDLRVLPHELDESREVVSEARRADPR